MLGDTNGGESAFTRAKILQQEPQSRDSPPAPRGCRLNHQHHGVNAPVSTVTAVT